MSIMGKLKVHISNRQNTLRIAGNRLRKLLESAAPAEWDNAELSLVLVNGEEMRRLNKRHTGRDEETDVLAFPLADNADELIGEIIVCTSRAVAEADARGVAVEDELALYIVHGALHLMGLDDHSPGDRRKMYARERAVLQLAGIQDVRRSAELNGRRMTAPIPPKGRIRRTL